ncbi:hypothetical protein B484DRAFT_456750 [Ochromonadaceae sp. CCMP2298]|nr:hypothetical protein B484DRAFT_456750 [Ochromonadaceae sp. CCMP2298]
MTTALIFEKLRDPVIRSKLVGAGCTWFLWDIAFYGFSLLGGYVLSEILDSDDDVSSATNVRAVCSKQATAGSLGAASVVFAIYLFRFANLRWIQIYGFLTQCGFFVLLAGVLTPLSDNPDGLFGLYCLVLMSLQFGPAVTTFSLPAALFDKEIRCTFNGISAAMGKMGAILGAYTFQYLAPVSLQAVLGLCAAVTLAGAYLTYSFLEDAMLVGDESAAASEAAAVAVAAADLGKGFEVAGGGLAGMGGIKGESKGGSGESGGGGGGRTRSDVEMNNTASPMVEL